MSLKTSVISGVACFLLGTAGLAAQPASAGGSWASLRDNGNKALQGKKLADAERYFQGALTQAEKFAPRDPRLAESLDNMAQLRQEQKRYADAETLYKRSFELRKKALESGDAMLSLSLMNLMIVYSLEGKNAEASKLYKSEKAISQHVKPVRCEYCDEWETLQPVYYGEPTPPIKDLARRGKIKLLTPTKGKGKGQWYCMTCDAALDRNGKAVRNEGH